MKLFFTLSLSPPTSYINKFFYFLFIPLLFIFRLCLLALFMLQLLRDNPIFNQDVSGKYRKTNKRTLAIHTFILCLLPLSVSLYSLFIYLGMTTTQINYTSSGGDDNSKIINITVPVVPGKQMFLYIGTKFNQANLKYSKSINYDQLKGKTVNLDLNENSDFEFGKNGLPYYPAGSLAATFFQDIILVDNKPLLSSGITYEDERKIIGYTGYREGEINIPRGWSRNTGANTTPLNFPPNSRTNLPILNERFINWINIGSFPGYHKLWGKFRTNKSEINLKVTPKSKYIDDSYILITDSSYLGIRNFGFTITLFIIGMFGILLSFILIKFS